MEEEVKTEKIVKKKLKLKGEVIDLIKTFATSLIAVWLLTTFIFTPVRVDGLSMYPTLDHNDLGISNIFSAQYLGINRFDIVVVNDKSTESKDHWVKRVIGLPNETISCKDDIIYIDGKAIDQPFLDNDYANSQKKMYGYFTGDFNDIKLGEDEYFVMGDNRTNSTDSRVVGPFTRDNITCKDVLIYFPFNHLKVAK